MEVDSVNLEDETEQQTEEALEPRLEPLDLDPEARNSLSLSLCLKRKQLCEKKPKKSSVRKSMPYRTVHIGKLNQAIKRQCRQL